MPVFFDVICSWWLEVTSSVLLDIKMLASMFPRMFAFECLGCVSFSFLALPFTKRASLEFLSALLKGTQLISFFVRSFKFYSAILMLLEIFLCSLVTPTLPVNFIFFEGKRRLSNLFFTFSSDFTLTFITRPWSIRTCFENLCLTTIDFLKNF